MNILVTLDSNYLEPLRIMLYSLFVNNPGESFTIYVMHSRLLPEEVEHIDYFAAQFGSALREIKLDDNCFQGAPVLLHWTKEMYYRLLAYTVLPQDLHRILYLDPDILVINPIKELYNLDLTGYLYAAAYHSIASRTLNQLRLSPYEISNYYNSGVLLMNLELQREKVDEQAIYDFVDEFRNRLVLPDQDILNALFSKEIKPLDEKLYNYDARYYRYYNLTTGGEWDMDHVMRNTVILHFCGKKKPWKKDYNGRFQALYKHYAWLAEKAVPFPFIANSVNKQTRAAAKMQRTSSFL